MILAKDKIEMQGNLRGSSMLDDALRIDVGEIVAVEGLCKIRECLDVPETRVER